MEGKRMLLEVAAAVEGVPDDVMIVAAHRLVVRECAVVDVSDGGREKVLYVLTDAILVCKQRKADRKKRQQFEQIIDIASANVDSVGRGSIESKKVVPSLAINELILGFKSEEEAEEIHTLLVMMKREVKSRSMTLASPAIGKAIADFRARRHHSISQHIVRVAQSLSTQPNEGSSLLKEGYLEKRGGVVKNWKVRYMQLHEAEIRYFAKKGDKMAKGVIPLANCTVRIPADNMVEIFHPERRTFYLNAKTRDEAVAWMRAIDEAINTTAARLSTSV
uniref:PH domain-containing protein n=1 Tax=Palpitomonas bilix TaxID=652834 RepID=A0A7S3GJZ2_9EUKA